MPSHPGSPPTRRETGERTAETSRSHSAILLISCPDRKGLVASVTEFIFRNGGNIISLEQHVDRKERVFFMRLEWDLKDFDIPLEKFSECFQSDIAGKFGMQWKLHFSAERPRMAVFVSRLPHCLYDILARCQAGEWEVEPALIVSNHRALEPVAKNLGIDYQVFPITPDSKKIQEKRQLELLKAYRIDFIVLARYMQILSTEFIDHYFHEIINIHHSFLPAFPGAKPYHSAHERGVKVIGATSHYVSAELDTGPIIAQDVVPVSHTDSVEDLMRKGRDLEKVVLARAIWHHLSRKILVWRNRTIVFT
jgi:formyltetrahydrofolate deformylase